MKQKTGRKLLSFLLGLALVLGMIPGMSLTAYASSGEPELYVGETNALTTSSGNGWNYDATNHTLTLKDANITGTHTFADVPVNIYANNIDLTIVLEGDNTLQSEADRGKGIILQNGNIVIQGSGKLTVKAKYTGIDSINGSISVVGSNMEIIAKNDNENDGGYAIRGGDSCTISIDSNSHVIARGSGAGINTDGAVKIKDSVVKTTGGWYGIYGKSGVTIMDSTVDATYVGNVSSNRFAIFSMGATFVNNVPGTGWYDEEGAQEEKSIVASDVGQHLPSYKKVHFEPIQNAAVVKAPTGKSLTYNGQSQELVIAGTAQGGTMQYALGTDDKTAPTAWSETIPTGTDAGTYYVWYKVVGDDTHAGVDPDYVTVTIKEAEKEETKEEESEADDTKGVEKVSTEVKSDEKSPALKADNLDEKFAESTLTSDEKTKIAEAVAAGQKVDVDVYLEIENIADSVPATDKEKVEAVVADSNAIEYFDISLFKEILIDAKSQGATALHTLATPLKLTIGVPKSFPAVADGYTRTYTVIRLHDGVAEKLPTTLNADGTISFETDKFSTYALAYTDVKQETTKVDAPTTDNTTTKSPATGDQAKLGIVVMLMLDSGIAALYLALRKKMLK